MNSYFWNFWTTIDQGSQTIESKTVDGGGTTVVNREAKLTHFTLVIDRFLSNTSPEFLLDEDDEAKKHFFGLLFFLTFR